MQAKGNAAFSAGNYEEAIQHFTAAIEKDPSNHVLYSNRSASHVRVPCNVEQLPAGPVRAGKAQLCEPRHVEKLLAARRCVSPFCRRA